MARNEELVSVALTITGRMTPSRLKELRDFLKNEEVAVAEDIHLTPAHMRLLRALEAVDGSIASTELGKAAGVKVNSQRALLSHLARIGLVERDRPLSGPTSWRLTSTGRSYLGGAD